MVDLSDLAVAHNNVIENRVTASLYGKRLTIEQAQTSMPFGNCIELRRWRAKVEAMFAEIVS